MSVKIGKKKGKEISTFIDNPIVIGSKIEPEIEHSPGNTVQLFEDNLGLLDYSRLSMVNLSISCSGFILRSSTGK